MVLTEAHRKTVHVALVALREAENALIASLGEKDPAADFTPAEAAWIKAFREQDEERAR